MARDNKQNKSVPVGEQTKAQPRGGVSDVASTLWMIPSYPAVEPGTYKLYRKIRGNPTVALARTAATSPILIAKTAVKADDGVPDEIVKFIQRQIDLLWSKLLRDMLLALDYGWQSFEKVYAVEGGRVVMRKMKPLLPDVTEVRTDKATGEYRGVKNMNTELGAGKAMIFTYDEEYGNYYGRSRHENIRKTWSDWDALQVKEGQYVTKSAGVIPMLQYPEGMGKDKHGNETDNFELAEKILQNLGKGHGVAMPNTLAAFAHEMMRAGVDLAQLRAWHFEFVDPGVARGTEFVGMMQHKESLMMRGWLVPERTALEGTHGTLAEANAHANIALVAAEMLLNDIIAKVNAEVVDSLLTINFGPQAKGKVRLAAEALSDDKKAMAQQIITTLLTSPMNIGLLQALVDVDAMMDMTGLPKAKQVVNLPAEGAPPGGSIPPEGIYGTMSRAAR